MSAERNHLYLDTTERLPLHYPETTEELRLWLSARNQLNTGDRDQLIFRRARYEISCGYRGISSRDITIAGSNDPNMLTGKRITEWGMQTRVSQFHLYFGHHGEMVTFEAPTMPHIVMNRELAEALSTIRMWQDGELKYTPPEHTSLRIHRANWAQRRSKAAARKYGEDFDRAWCEEHIVVGLLLEGMSNMGFIYAVDPSEENVLSAYGDLVMSPLIPMHRAENVVETVETDHVART